MAWYPISYTVPQYLDTSVSPPQPASGFVLKAYKVGTTTNIPFATDNEGQTTVNDVALNAQGYPEVSGNVIIPHMDQDYKLALYPDQSAADSDTGAIWTIDDIDLVQITDTTTAADYNVWPLVDYGGAYLDGTNDYLTRGSGLTGASDGKKGTLVAFVTFDNTASAQEYILHATGEKLLLRRDSDGKFRIIAENSSGTTILNMATSNAYEGTDTVYCIMASWDLGTPGSNQIYVNDTSDGVTTTFTNDTIDYTVADWAVGADVGGASKITGNVLSVWLDITDNLDFDGELNRRRFLDEQDNPVYLGAQGELPSAAQPILFLGNKDETSFESNRGSGGDFTENGTLAAATVDFDGQYSRAIDATDSELEKTADATSSNTANTLVERDANARAQFTDPAAAQDAATRDWVFNNLARIATGTYTGDGSTSQGITGVGFQPKYVRIQAAQGADGSVLNLYETWAEVLDDNASGVSIKHNSGGGHSTQQHKIISLDSDGFTVDDDSADSDPNANGTSYNYMAIG